MAKSRAPPRSGSWSDCQSASPAGQSRSPATASTAVAKNGSAAQICLRRAATIYRIRENPDRSTPSARSSVGLTSAPLRMSLKILFIVSSKVTSRP